MALHAFTIPLAVQGPMDALFQEATNVGINLGQDRDWVPKTVDEALFELLLIGSDRLCYTDPRNPHYPFVVSVHMDQDDFLSFAQQAHFFDPRGVEATLFGALGHADSPSELHFEIEGIGEATTAHDALARHALLQSILT
jgi:hypothetical protein